MRKLYPRQKVDDVSLLYSVLEFRVQLSDIDINMHMNNSVYNLQLDYARFEFLDLLLGKHSNQWRVANGGVTCTFSRELKPFVKYRIETKILSYNTKWLILEHVFVSGKDCVHCTAQSKLVFKSKSVKGDRGGPSGKTVPVPEVLVALEWYHSQEEALSMPWVAENWKNVSFLI
jgi:acyl-CoA thioesterase FadM